jgi:hypothetical protein
MVPAEVMTLTQGVLKAMLLTKLKITFCAAGLMLLAGIGATGLTYRVTAQEPRQGVAQASRTQSDELEVLRLEMEALRKEVRVLRDRLKLVEDQSRVHKTATTDRVAVTEETETIKLPVRIHSYTKYKTVDDPLGDAEAAIKKLRANPSDKDAAEALERALKRLKARTSVEPRPSEPRAIEKPSDPKK